MLGVAACATRELPPPATVPAFTRADAEQFCLDAIVAYVERDDGFADESEIDLFCFNWLDERFPARGD